jgi:hypothetical protein
MMKKTLSFILLLNFLFAVSQSQETITQSVEVLKNNMSLITLIVLFTFVFSAFAYFFGKILNMGSVKAWAKDQIYEAFLSLFIGLIGIFILENFFLNQNFGYLLSSAGLVPDACKGMSDLFQICECELSSFLNNLSGFLWLVFSADSLIGTLSMLYIGGKIAIPPTVPYITIGVEIQPFRDVGNDISGALSTAYQLLVFSFVLVSFQIYLLNIVPYLFLFFFPAGVLLRSFGVTRKVGGSLIALSIGLTLLYPILVAIGYGYVIVTYPPLTEKLETFSAFSVLSGVLSGISGGLAQLPLGKITDVLVGISKIFFVLQILGGFVSTIVLVIYIFFNIELLAPLILGILVVPAIIFYVLDNFIRDFSRLAGAEVSVLGLVGQLI